MNSRTILIVLFLSLLVITSAFPAILRVDPSAAGLGDGSTWADAYPSLGDALNAAVSGDEIWVKGGTYIPTLTYSFVAPGTSDEATFRIKNGVSIYGGFGGIGVDEQTRSERDIQAYPTTLAGGAIAFTATNSWHVVRPDGNNVIDGFTISNGYADTSGTWEYYGGGIMFQGISGTFTLRNCNVRDNWGRYCGGAFLYSGIPITIENCSFTNNETDHGNNYGDAGGIWLENPTSLVIKNSIFAFNTSRYYGGGRFHCWNGDGIIENCVISNNTATYRGGAGYFMAQDRNLDIVNCTIINNSATSFEGGPTFDLWTGTTYEFNMKNCIMWGNTAPTDPYLRYYNQKLTMSGCNIEGSGGSDSWDSNFGNDSGDNIDTDPLVQDADDALGADGVPFTVDDGMNLTLSSPCVDSAVTGDAPFMDIIGTSRPYGGGADMGAYECTYKRWFVNANASGAGTGASWEDAFTKIQEGLDAATAGHEVWVTKNTYSPTSDTAGNEDPADYRNKVLHLNAGSGAAKVSLYGGFDGNETTLSERDNDSKTIATAKQPGGTTSYRVFLTDHSNTIDGFVIRDAKLEGNSGGGVYNNAKQRVTVRNCEILDNTGYQGSGIYSAGGNMTIENCLFENNKTEYRGGGFFGWSGGNHVIRDCQFIGNSAQEGGAIRTNSSTVVIDRCLMKDNTVSNRGGGFYSYLDNLTMTNCVVIGNSSSGEMGAGYIYTGGTSRTVQLFNCTMYGNTDIWTSGGVYWYTSGTKELRNCVIYGNVSTNGSYDNFYGGGATYGPITTYSVIPGWTTSYGSDGTGVVGTDPLFIDPLDPLGPDENFGTADDGLRFREGSPCLEPAGTPVGGPTVDVTGAPRVGNNDMGAYEGAVIIRYVDYLAPGADGLTWPTAYPDLQDAIADSPEEIWVAQGTYTPGATEADSFTLPVGCRLYGGFPTGGVALRSERFGNPNLTILSGDGAGTPGDDTDNSFNVVTASNLSLLDGFSIVKGYADGAVPAEESGAGIYAKNVTAFGIRKCVIRDNFAERDGAGLYIENTAYLGVYKTLFKDNSSLLSGGAMYCKSDTTTPFIINTVFETNDSDMGGALVINDSKPYIINCVFYNNTAVTDGGAIHAVYPALFGIGNCTMVMNSAGGDGDAINYTDGPATFMLVNSILWNGGADEINGSGYTAAYNNTQGGALDGVGNISELPLFTDAQDPEGADSRWRTEDDGFNLLRISPCLNAGNAAYTADFDIVNNDRPQNGEADMGAYETFVPSIIYVDDDATGDNDGSSWVNAYTDLQDALTAASDGFEIWIAAGTYKPSVQNSGARTETFQMISGVPLVGGFVGGSDGEVMKSQRDWRTNLSILDGDIGTVGTDTDNTCAVVYAASDTELDGVVIQNARADNPWWESAAIRTVDGGDSCIIRNCVIRNNYAGSLGALAYFNGGWSYVEISDSYVYSNSTGSDVAVAYMPSVTTLLVKNSVFHGNSTNWNSGVFYLDNVNAEVINSTFVGNSTTGDDTCIIMQGGSVVSVTNSVFYSNPGGNTFGGGAVGNLSGANNLVEEGWIVGTDLGGNIAGNPGFNSTDVDGADNVIWTVDDGLVPVAPSPIIDTGLNSAATFPEDIRGDARIQDGDGATVVDMGAIEAPNPLTITVTVPSSAAENDGTVTGTVTLSIDPGVGGLTVTLVSDDTDEVTVPATLDFAQGELTQDFDLTILQDYVIDGDDLVTITATSGVWQGGSDDILILDNGLEKLVQIFVPETSKEGDGSVTGTVEIPAVWDADVTFALTSSDTGQATVPSSVTISQGETTADFNITIIDDGTVDGIADVIIGASLAGWLPNPAEDKISILDNDGAGADTDSDGMDDGWETFYFGDISISDGTGDYDGDLLQDLDEYNNFTDPTDTDSDNDGVTDGLEVNGYNTDPNYADTDNDGLTDGEEIDTYNTNPNDTDSDNDGLSDYAELNTHNTDPNNSDTDGDQMPDGWEYDNDLDPLVNDANFDADGDGYTNFQEYENDTDPQLEVASYFGLAAGCSFSETQSQRGGGLPLIALMAGCAMVVFMKKRNLKILLILLLVFSTGSLIAQEDEEAAPLLFDDLFDDDTPKDDTTTDTPDDTVVDDVPDDDFTTDTVITEPIVEDVFKEGLSFGVDLGMFNAMGASVNGYGGTVGFGLAVDFGFGDSNIIELKFDLYNPTNSEESDITDSIMLVRGLYLKQNGKMIYGGGLGIASNNYTYGDLSGSIGVMIIEGMLGYKAGPGFISLEYMMASGSENVSGILGLGYKYMF